MRTVCYSGRRGGGCLPKGVSAWVCKKVKRSQLATEIKLYSLTTFHSLCQHGPVCCARTLFVVIFLMLKHQQNSDVLSNKNTNVNIHRDQWVDISTVHTISWQFALSGPSPNVNRFVVSHFFTITNYWCCTKSPCH